MTRSFLRFTPALALIATLGLGAAQAQTNTPAATNTPAVSAKTSDVAPAATHKKNPDTATHVKAGGHKHAAKKTHQTVANQNAKAATPATPATPASPAPKS